MALGNGKKITSGVRTYHLTQKASRERRALIPSSVSLENTLNVTQIHKRICLEKECGITTLSRKESQQSMKQNGM